MTTLRYDFLPGSAEFPTSNFPQYLKVNDRDVLAFDATTSENCSWSFAAPQGVTTPLTAVVHFMAASATSGTFQPDVSIEAITPGDATDLDAGTSFDTVNAGAATTVPGTAGFEQVVSITLTNNDSIAAGDRCRLKLARNISDTAAGDIYVLGVELRDAA